MKEYIVHLSGNVYINIRLQRDTKTKEEFIIEAKQHLKFAYGLKIHPDCIWEEVKN